MRSLKKNTFIFGVGIIVSLLTISCDPMHTNKYTFENNSDSTLFVSLSRSYKRDTIPMKLIKNNWKEIPAHTISKLGEFGLLGKLSDDQLMFFKDSIKFTFDTLTKIGVKKDINNYSNWKRKVINNTNEYSFSVTNTDLK